MKIFACIFTLAACGDNTRVQPTDSGPDHPMTDAAIDAAPADAPPMVRVFGNIDFNGGLDNVAVSIVGGTQNTHTDPNGDFSFDVPDGSRLILLATATGHPELLPMLRGVIAHDDIRPRVFYLMGPPDVASAATLGKTFDPSKAIVEVDYRNAQIGGYGATLTRGGNPVTPGFGFAYDDNSNPVLSQITVAGGGGSTLLLADLSPGGDVSFAAEVPVAATLPCQPRDADPLPLVAGTVTWFDYECGNATD